MKILALQPFFGGSHQQFHNGWVSHSDHDWSTIALPDRHWKWRMRHSAIHFAQEVGDRYRAGERWDAMICTDMMNVAEFRGLTPMMRDVPLVVYFHENQFAYPDRFHQERDQHFAFTNFVSAFAADQIWFNSLWAARWEHDKNPSGLLETLRKLRALGVPFKLSVIGQQYRKVPPEFATIHSEFADVIERWGYQQDRASYWQALCEADVFMSTATHEFFGLAAAEAIASGIHSLLPDRLAYPELLKSSGVPSAGSCLYGQTPEDLASCIVQLHANREHFGSPVPSSKFRDRLSWSRRAREMDHALRELKENADR